MACLKVLKEEIRGLEATFPRVHPRLQIVSASVDELTCKFVDPAMRKHTIHANITVRINFFKVFIENSVHFKVILVLNNLGLQYKLKEACALEVMHDFDLGLDIFTPIFFCPNNFFIWLF